MSEHTPGPWRLAENDQTIVVTDALNASGDCRVVADVLMHEGEAGLVELANARLIAAAPDMLAALGETVLALQMLGLDGWSDAPHLMKICTAAIAKATFPPTSAEREVK